MKHLLANIRACEICGDHLPLGPRPVLSVHPQSKILIIGQAPGTKVHESGVPWDDASGRELRRWLDLDDETFYNEKIFGLMPMGFCYPGKGKSGDMPPRPECAPAWHAKLHKHLKNAQLTLLIGNYSQQYYLGTAMLENLTATVKSFKKYLPQHCPLPHPSPRTRIWQKKNPWFDAEVLPELRRRAHGLLGLSTGGTALDAPT